MRVRTPAVAVAACLAALLSTAAPASADTPPVREGDSSSVVDRVADFYAAYTDARTGSPDTDLAGALRAHYLTRDFRSRLRAWEHQNHADGVFRAQNTPLAWQVSYDGSGTGHTWTKVRLTWADSHYSYLSVQSDLSTKLISDIEEAPAP